MNLSTFENSQELNPEIFASELTKEMTEGTVGGDDAGGTNPDMLMPTAIQGSATAVWNMIKDLHLELILMYHRVCLKLTALGPPQGEFGPVLSFLLVVSFFLFFQNDAALNKPNLLCSNHSLNHYINDHVK